MTRPTLLGSIRRRRRPEGPAPHRAGPGAAAAQQGTPATDDQIRQVFDADWYLASYADVRISGQDPWRHFIAHGIREGRDPGPWFDSGWYLSAYPAARETGALRHFLSVGLAQGNRPNPRWEATGWWPGGRPPTLAELPGMIASERTDEIGHAASPLAVPTPLRRSAGTWELQLAAFFREQGDEARR